MVFCPLHSLKSGMVEANKGVAVKRRATTAVRRESMVKVDERVKTQGGGVLGAARTPRVPYKLPLECSPKRLSSAFSILDEPG